MNSKLIVTLTVQQALFIKQAVQNSRGDDYDTLRKELFELLPPVQHLEGILRIDNDG